jgi:hypothetical protein
MVWSAPLDDSKHAEKVASSIGRRVRELVGDDAELAKAVGTAGIWYFVKSDGEPARRSLHRGLSCARALYLVSPPERSRARCSR